MAIASVSAHLDEQGAGRGPGLWARTFRKSDGAESEPVVTNIRVAGSGRKPGTWLVNIAAVLLFALGTGLLAVSLAAQYRFIDAERNQHLASIIEAGALDLGMVIFSLLALGLARAGKPAKIERALVVVCAAGSALMNYAAANVDSPRSVLAYCMPPCFLAVVTDRVVVTIRRHVLGMREGLSPWSVLGRTALYSLRFALAPISTATGMRRYVLESAPVPTVAASVPAKAVTPPAPVQPAPRHPRMVTSPPARIQHPRAGSKQAALIKLATEEHGLLSLPLAEVSGLATRLAPQAEIHPATARRVLLGHARSLQNGGAK